MLRFIAGHLTTIMLHVVKSIVVYDFYLIDKCYFHKFSFVTKFTCPRRLVDNLEVQPSNNRQDLR